jgi:hypothetical protein
MLIRTFTITSLGLLLTISALASANARQGTVAGAVNTALRNLSKEYPQKFHCNDYQQADGSLKQVRCELD